jgi:hypothetical protein
MLQKQKKSCALCHNIDWGRNRIIPGPLVAAHSTQTNKWARHREPAYHALATHFASTNFSVQSIP